MWRLRLKLTVAAKQLKLRHRCREANRNLTVYQITIAMPRQGMGVEK